MQHHIGKTFRHATPLLLIITVGVVLRVAAAFYLGDQVVELPGTADQISYHTLALRVLDGHGFSFDREWWPLTAPGAPTAHWSYLYTFYLTAVYTVFGPHPLVARLIQAILVGILHPYLAFRLGSRVFDRKVGLVAAGFTSLYVYFIYYAAALMTEPFYITAILAVLMLVIELAKSPSPKAYRLALPLGVMIGSVVLFRQLFLLMVPVIFAWLGWGSYKRWGRVPVAPLLLAVAIVGAMILPFTAYNYARFDSFVLLNTNAGYAFFWGNHPIYGTQFVPILPPDTGGYESLIPTSLRHLDEAALEKELMQRGIQFVLDDPVRYLLLSLSRVPHYFMFWPSADSGLFSNIARLASFTLLLPFMLYGLVVSWTRKRRVAWVQDPSFLLILFVAAYSILHILSWALVRYRLPVDAVLLIFASVAIVTLFERASWRKHASLGAPSPTDEPRGYSAADQVPS